MRARHWPWLLGAAVAALVFRELFLGQVQAARDLSGHVFAETHWLLSRWRAGEVPLWLPHARLGQPFAALLYTQVFYLPRLLTALAFGAVLGPNVLHALHALLAFSGGFFAARRLGLSRAAAFVSAAPFAFAPAFTELAQNLSFASTAAWAGWILYAAEGLRQRPGAPRVALFALVAGAALHAGSPEMWLWALLFAAAVLARSPRALPHAAAGVVWAVAIALVVAWPAFELSREWTRPGSAPEGRLEWSLSPAQVLALLVPDGDLPRAPGQWGADQRFLFTLFLGSLATLLALVGAGVRRARAVALVTLTCLCLALGRHLPLTAWLFELPPLRLFRYPAKYAVGVWFGASVLAGFGARRLAALARKGAWRPLLAVVGFALGVVVSARVGEAREGLRDGVAWLALAALALAVVGRWPGALAVAVALECVLAPVERWERLPARELSRPSTLARALRQAPDGHRLSIRVDLDDVEHEDCGPWDEGGDPLLQGRERLSALRFVEEDLRAVGGYGFRNPWRLQEAFARGPAAFAVAGVADFVRETWAPPPVPGLSVRPSPIADVWVWRSPEPLPRGFFVQRVTVADDAAAFDALTQPVAALRAEVLVHRGTTSTPERECASPVETTEVRPEHVEQRVAACSAGALVLADAWDPGWTVEVDGVPGEPLRAWGFLRAVQVGPGAHTVTWRYRPTSWVVGRWVSLLALLAALAVAARGRR